MENGANEIAHFIKPKLVKNLKTILHNTTFCTVCFEITEDLLHLDNSLVIEDLQGEALTLRELMQDIFGNTPDWLASDYICVPCKSSAWSSFCFINKTKKTALIYKKYLEELDKETLELTRHAVDNEWKNAMIILNDHHESIEVIKPKIEANRLYICDLCSKGYSHRRFLIKHLKIHNTRAVKCPHCVTRPCMHEKYILAFTEQRLSKQKLTCIDCGHKFGKSLSYLIAHVNKEHFAIKTNICEECGKSFYLHSHYSRHFEYHHSDKYVCTYCFCKFRSMKHLKSHMEPCISTEQPFKCSKCPVRSKTKLTNEFHMATHTLSYCERSLKQPTTKIKIRRNKIYRCLVCNGVLKTKLELRTHINNKHEKKPNLCLYCNKQFSSRQEYLVHVQTWEHRKNIPYNAFKYHCSHCDYSSGTEALLKAHVNRVHLNVRPFQCEYCHKRYFDSTQLKNHIKTHTGRKLKVCDICGAHLAGPTALKKHRRLHTGENPYACPYCDVKTNCASSLKTHIMRKHMEPTIVCPLCDLKFHTMNNARGHVRKVHWKSKDKFDYTKLKGLSPKDYDFFRDRRKAVV